MSCIDKKGRPFRVIPYSPDDYSELVAMYDNFFPKAKFQGMPPSDREKCCLWIDGLLKTGENFLAWREGRVIGHVVVLPDYPKGDAEYLIFVNQSDRGCGVGSELTRAAIDAVKALGIKTIWLTVDAYNFRAMGLYKKFGLSFCDDYHSGSERTMTLKL